MDNKDVCDEIITAPDRLGLHFANGTQIYFDTPLSEQVNIPKDFKPNVKTLIKNITSRFGHTVEFEDA